MINKNIQDALNDQLTFEIYSAYTYKAMAAYFANKDLSGMENFFNIQTKEELTHAEKIYKYISDSGARVRYGQIDEPRFDYSTPLEAFEVALKHEQVVTARMGRHSDLAIAESDHATRIFLEWFVTEQVEEEASFSAIIAKLKLIGDDGQGLLMLDQELGQRVFTPPAGEKT